MVKGAKSEREKLSVLCRISERKVMVAKRVTPPLTTLYNINDGDYIVRKYYRDDMHIEATNLMAQIWAG